MDLKILCLKDVKMGFLQPFTSNDEKVIMVQLERAVNDDKISYLEDKELWNLGFFNDETGYIVHEKPQFLCRLIDLKKKERSVSDEV